MVKRIALINEKGGVGKTTTTIELAAQLSKANKSVLVVDLDGQANASSILLGKNKRKKTIADYFLKEKGLALKDIIHPASGDLKNCSVIPSDKRLSGIEPHLNQELNREKLLMQLMDQVSGHFDFVLFDLPPAMNLITINGLVASTHYLVLSDTSEFSLIGLQTIQEVVGRIKTSGLNNSLQLLGVLVTGYQKGISIAVREFLSELDRIIPNNPLKGCMVPHSTKVQEAHRKMVPLGFLLPNHAVSEAYKKTAKFIISSN